MARVCVVALPLPPLLLLVVVHLLTVALCLTDPYATLNVASDADMATIKRGYKRLARHWHPDKNRSPEAKSRFVDINNAYQLLADPERRQRYDMFGVSDDQPRRSGWRGAFQYVRMRRGAGDFGASYNYGSYDGAGAGGGGEGGYRSPTAALRRAAVSLTGYREHVLPGSWLRATLLLAYMDWCAACGQLVPVWRRLESRLAPLGVATGTVHVQLERQLAAELGVTTAGDQLPQLVLVIDGQVVPVWRAGGAGGGTTDRHISADSVVDAIGERLAAAARVASHIGQVPALRDWLAGWPDNRVRLVMFAAGDRPLLRHASLAFKYRALAAAAYVSTKSPSVSALLPAAAPPAAASRAAAAETLLVFKENTDWPAAQLSSSASSSEQQQQQEEQLSFDAMCQLVDEHRFLLLPRLSSQPMFDWLCPAAATTGADSSQRSQRHLCAVVLISGDCDSSSGDGSSGSGSGSSSSSGGTDGEDTQLLKRQRGLTALRRHVAHTSSASRRRRVRRHVRYVLLDTVRQPQLWRALLTGCTRSCHVPGDVNGHVIVLRRTTTTTTTSSSSSTTSSSSSSSSNTATVLHYQWLPVDYLSKAGSISINTTTTSSANSSNGTNSSGSSSSGSGRGNDSGDDAVDGESLVYGRVSPVFTELDDWLLRLEAELSAPPPGGGGAGGGPLPLRAMLSEPLCDENAPGLWRRLISRLYRVLHAVTARLHTDQLVPTASATVTVLLLLAGGYLMSHLARLEEASVQRQYRSQAATASGSSPSSTAATTTTTTTTFTAAAAVVADAERSQLRVHELRAETFNGLVRLLKPGCRTLVLLVDTDSRQRLVGQFRRAVWPYRRNRTLLFAVLLLERGLAWYRRLLLPHLDGRLVSAGRLNINPKNCIGTVLSINGHRKYFCMFHAKHSETRRTRSASDGRTSSRGGGGEFLGLDSSGDDDSCGSTVDCCDAQLTGGVRGGRGGVGRCADVLFEEHLLDGLPDWLDRLFEGQTVRYHLNFWPDWVGK